MDNWRDLGKRVDQFAARTLQKFMSTSAHVLTQWIEGSVNAREAFRRIALQVIDGIIQITVQSILANAIGKAILAGSQTESASSGIATAAILSAA